MVADPLHPMYPEGIFDVRIWQPPQLPKKAHMKWYGRPVRVVWQHPSFDIIGYVQQQRGSKEKQPIWECRWFGYVVELDEQVPEEELIRQPKLKEPQ